MVGNQGQDSQGQANNQDLWDKAGYQMVNLMANSNVRWDRQVECQWDRKVVNN